MNEPYDARVWTTIFNLAAITISKERTGPTTKSHDIRFYDAAHNEMLCLTAINDPKAPPVKVSIAGPIVDDRDAENWKVLTLTRPDPPDNKCAICEKEGADESFGSDRVHSSCLDEIMRERDEAEAERDEAEAERDEAVKERDDAIEDRNDAVDARNQALADRDAATAERDSF